MGIGQKWRRYYISRNREGVLPLFLFCFVFGYWVQWFIYSLYCKSSRLVYLGLVRRPCEIVP